MTANSLVETWTKDRALTTRDQFRSRHPYAFLVWSPSFKARGANARPSMQQLSFHTQVHGADTKLVPVAHNTGHDLVLILPLKKAPESPFPDRVSVGRAPNCDIVVRDSSVSKLHGHFRDITINAAVFTDAKSANGTTLDGVKLEPGVSTPISEFSVIAFGRVRLRLLSPGAVYDWLGQQR
ncbi:MAG: FHA domain-containing protein [Polyangiales bacterium]